MIDDFYRWWRAEMLSRPAMIFVMLIWTVCAIMNFRLGWAIGGRGTQGLLLGSCFVGIAGLGAYASVAQASAKGFARKLLWLLVFCQIGLGQIAGWQSIGFTLSAGATDLSNQATSRATIKDQYERLKAERQKLGITRAIKEIGAEETLECEKKSKIYPDGIGPKCTGLRAERARAEKAAEIDRKLPELAAALKAAPLVEDAEAGTRVPATLAAVIGSYFAGREVSVTGNDVRFVLEVFLVALLEFVATLGPWLFGSTHKPPPKNHPQADYWASLPREWTPRDPLLFAPETAPPTSGGPAVRPAPSEIWPVAGSFNGPAHVQGFPPAPPASAGAPVSAPLSSAMHGAPITINMSSPAPVIAPPAQPPPAGPGGPPPSPTGQSPDQAMAAARTSVHRTAPITAPTPEAAKRPVDRSAINELGDQLLVFKAACCSERDGALVTIEDLWGRYASWAGARAMAREAFVTMFPLCTGNQRVDFGGIAHVQGLEFSLPPKLAAVS